ncbi:MAG TPA: hypothetical protein VGI64_23270 [Streptosporangiaceae bacterium]|jgi:guanylate kinase
MDGRPVVFVVSGPSGAGKGTALEWMTGPGGISRVPTYTTRPPRPGERDGTDYHFVSEQEFFSLYRRGAIFEYTRTYSESYYGSPRALLQDGGELQLAAELDPTGFARVRAVSARRVVGIFITTTRPADLRGRLAARGQGEDTARRLQVRTEQQRWALVYDYLLVNDDREQFLADLATVVGSELIRLRGARHLVSIRHDSDPTLS